ncbi:MAG: hypothetical protein WBC07_09735 [Methylotenera sp.]
MANHPESENRVKYFSHYAGTGCSNGYETALHLAAKRVLIEQKKLLVPKISAELDLFDAETKAKGSAKKIISSKEILLETVEQEVREFDGIVPDIVATAYGKIILIEISVTHPVDELKLEKLIKLGYPVIQIHLKPEKETPSIEDIAKLVIKNQFNREWLVNNKIQRLENLVKVEAERKLEIAKKRVFMKREQEIKARERYLLLSDSEKLKIELNLKMINFESVKSLIGIKITGDGSFQVSNQVWQASIYSRFIHDRQGKIFEKEDVLTWLKGRFKVASIFKDSPQIAIHYYLKLLQENKLIERIYQDAYTVSRDSTGRDYID